MASALNNTDIAHLSRDSKIFALTLRETDRQTFSKKLQRKLEEKASNPSTIVDIQKKPIKYEKPCNLSKCLSVEDSIRLELIERENILKKIEKTLKKEDPLKVKLQEAEDDLELIKKEGAELTNQLSKLLIKEKKETSEKLIAIQAQGKALESQLFSNEIVVRRARRAYGGVSLHGVQKSYHSAFDEDHVPWKTLIDTIKAPEICEGPRKHNGAFKHINHRNEEVWSCCLVDKRDGVGCMDDHSVDLKPSLAVKPKDSYHPTEGRNPQVAAFMSTLSLSRRSHSASALTGAGKRNHRTQNGFGGTNAGYNVAQATVSSSATPTNSTDQLMATDQLRRPSTAKYVSRQASFSNPNKNISVGANALTDWSPNVNRSSWAASSNPNLLTGNTLGGGAGNGIASSSVTVASASRGLVRGNSLSSGGLVENDLNLMLESNREGAYRIYPPNGSIGTLDGPSFLAMTRVANATNAIGKVYERPGKIQRELNKPLTYSQGPHLFTTVTTSPSVSAYY